VLIGADFSQIELRVAALLSGDWNMLDAYRSGIDLHRKTAAAIAGCAVDAVTPQQRNGAKPVNFGNLYGQAAKGLAKQAKLDYGVDMTTSDASQALLKFQMAYPQLEHWKRQQVAKAMQYRQVQTKLGLVRDFDAQHQGYLKGEAQNCPVQGSAAEVLLASLVRLPDALKGTDATLYHTVHDEIELACSPDCADQAAAGLQDAMVQGFIDVFPEGAALTNGLVDVHTGSSWAAVH
jgi:DNA polymerase-1